MKYNRTYTFLIIAFVSLFTQLITAQVYPTQITPVLHPPYATTVEDYSNGFSDKITASVFTSDLTVEQRQVQLKLRIQGPGMNAESTPVINGYVPLYIQGGELLQLSNQDLAPYFQFENLTGITPQQYSTSLPEGMYEFCLEVIDFQTQQKISQTSCASAYFVVNQPPMLNTPLDHENITQGDPQNILFTWTPMHLNATDVEYEFSLVEILDDQTPTQNAFLYSQPLYVTTTSNTILNYGPAEPMLIVGRKYAWRVRAQVPEGISANTPFLNDGYSVIFDFTYAGNCPEPQFTLANPISDTQCEITWQPNSSFSSYLLQYRKLGEEEWFEVEVYSEQAMLYDLEGGETYEFRVGGNCFTDLISFSNINQFTQPFDQNPEGVTCGIQPDLDLENQNLLSGPLGDGQVFTAGDFPIHVISATGDGSYSGEGWTKAPYLGTLKLAVEFEDIQINTDMQLVSGEVSTVYDSEWSNILSVNEVLDTIEDADDLITGEDDQNEIEVPDAVIGSVDQITINEDTGEIEITDADGNLIYTADYDDGETYVITDSEGNVFHIDEDGVITQQGVGAGAINADTTDGVDEDGEVTQLQDAGMKVTFMHSDISGKESQYFTDSGPPSTASQKIKDLYKVIQDADSNNYPLIYKAVAKEDGGCGDTPCFDWVKAEVEITGENVSLDSLMFVMNGTLLESEIISSSNNAAEIALKLPAFNSAGVDEVLALLKTADKKQVVGAMMNVQIKEVGDVNLVLVPVNVASIDLNNIQNNLNSIYDGAGAHFKVSIAENWDVSDTQMEVGTSGWFTGYTSDQNNFISAYKNSGVQLNDDTYYLFIMNGITPTGRPVEGYMPFKKQFGFIFPDQTSAPEESKANMNEVIAHELGHGVFEIKHPWDQFNDASENQTDWLMDYSGGTKLPYIHWQQIGHPQFRLYEFLGNDETSNNGTVSDDDASDNGDIGSNDESDDVNDGTNDNSDGVEDDESNETEDNDNGEIEDNNDESEETEVIQDEAENEDPPLYVEYANQKYYDGDQITLTFKRNLEAIFQLKDVEQDKVKWDNSDISYFSKYNNKLRLKLNEKLLNTSSGTYITGYIDENNELSGSVPSDYENKVKNIISISVKPYSLTDFITYDASKPNRIARNNQTLYFVDKQNTGWDTRKAYTKIKASVASAYLPREQLEWKVNGNVVDGQMGDLRLNYNYKGENHTVQLNSPNGNFSNRIKFIESYDNSIDLLSKFNKVLVFLQEFNKYERKFGRYLPCTFSALRNFSALAGAQKVAFNLRSYNKEDENSREIFDINETTLKLKSSELASFKCSKSIGWNAFSLGNIYAKASLGANIDFKYRYKKRNETKTTKHEPNISGGLNLSLSGGLETNPDLEEYVYASGSIDLTAGIKTEWPYKGNNAKIASYLYTGKTYLKVQGYVDGGFLTGGRQEIPPMSWEIFDTSWESDFKIIFDIKDGDIYLETN